MIYLLIISAGGRTCHGSLKLMAIMGVGFVAFSCMRRYVPQTNTTVPFPPMTYKAGCNTKYFVICPCIALFSAHVTPLKDHRRSWALLHALSHKHRHSKFVSTKCLFLVTGHGKNTCDGVGDVIKHHATHNNHRSPATSAIKTA